MLLVEILINIVVTDIIYLRVLEPFNLNVPSASNPGFQYLVVGGGGAGGSGSPGPQGNVGGGGGGGGVLNGTGEQLLLTAGTYTISVGGGGANMPPGNNSGPDHMMVLHLQSNKVLIP